MRYDPTGLRHHGKYIEGALSTNPDHWALAVAESAFLIWVSIADSLVWLVNFVFFISRHHQPYMSDI